MTIRHKPPFMGTIEVKGIRLKGDNWTRLRNLFMRNHPTCSRCSRPGEEVHHKIPRSVRPDLCYDWENLETLCRECHRAEHGHKKPRF